MTELVCCASVRPPAWRPKTASRVTVPGLRFRCTIGCRQPRAQRHLARAQCTTVWSGRGLNLVIVWYELGTVPPFIIAGKCLHVKSNDDVCQKRACILSRSMVYCWQALSIRGHSAVARPETMGWTWRMPWRLPAFPPLLSARVAALGGDPSPWRTLSSQDRLDQPSPDRPGPERTPGACRASGTGVGQRQAGAGAILPQGGIADRPGDTR
jgi:hypothetical protein